MLKVIPAASPHDHAEKLNYEKQVFQQIQQYAQTINMHDLPDIFHVWSHNFVLPGIQDVFGVNSVNDFYVSAFLDSLGEQSSGEILSIGCGDGSVEIDIAKALLATGVKQFNILGADLSPILLSRMADNIRAEGLEAYVTPLEADLNFFKIDKSFDMIMANHSLHHIVDLEGIFDFSRDHLKDSGLFATSDMIGRNGHQRWPETAAVLSEIWPTLSYKQRFNVQLSRLDDVFTDHDCSTEGFEGVRAQDILPLMLDRFHPVKFLGFGGFIDVLVDRCFGHGFDANDADDVSKIMECAKLNEDMLDAGTIKPTMMMATFSKQETNERFYKTRSARRSVRPL